MLHHIAQSKKKMEFKLLNVIDRVGFHSFLPEVASQAGAMASVNPTKFNKLLIGARNVVQHRSLVNCEFPAQILDCISAKLLALHPRLIAGAVLLS
jgi:hypothetical protein